MIAENSQSASSLTALRQRAHQRFATQNKSIADIARANTRLRAPEEAWECTGVLQLGNRELRIEDMRFDNGVVLEFAGSAWGAGASSLGRGVFNVPPAELVAYDSVDFQVFFLTAGVGGVEVSFWNGTEFLGYFAAGRIGSGAGSLGGTGKFRYA